jgi:tetratricopeptide (TPR) repeat protein
MASPDELAQAYVVLGRLARDDGDATLAIKWLEAGLAKSQLPALKSELLTELGGLELKRRDWKAAMARFEAAIKASPADIDAHTGLGSAELGAGSPLRARKSSETARRFLDAEKLKKDRSAAEVERTHERTARLMSLRGRIFAHPEVNETADSVDAFRVAIEASRAIASEKAREIQAEVYVHYIQGLLARKSFNDALTVLRDAQKVIPDAPAVTAGFGDVYFEQAEYRAAEEAYKKTIAKAPNFVSAHFNLARVYGQTGRPALAQKALDLVQKLDPHYPGLRLELALNFRQQKRLADALNQFNLAIKENPKDPFLLIQIARANFDAGGRDALLDARRYLDQVVQQNPGIIEARYWRGRTLIALHAAGGEPNPQRLLLEAQDDLKAVTEKIAMNGVYRLWYAKTFDYLGNGTDALYHYEQAATLLTKDRNEVDIIEAQFRAARIRFAREELPAAKLLLDAILKRTRTHRGAYLLLGDYYGSSNQPAKAIEMYGRAIAQKAGNVEAHKKRAQAYMQVNLPQSALGDFRTVARLDPTDPEPHMMLGRAAKIAGQTAVAIREFETFLKLHQAKACRGASGVPYAMPTVEAARQAQSVRGVAIEVAEE